MNPYRANAPGWNEWSDKRGRSPALWSTVTDFFRRQPEFVLGGALVGGALLAYWVKQGSSGATQPPYPAATYASAGGNTPAAAQAPTAPASQPTGQGWSRHERRRAWAGEQEGPWRMPSARLGATEDQMEDLATPSAHSLEAGTPGATGAAYDLDPNSITGG